MSDVRVQGDKTVGTWTANTNTNTTTVNAANTTVYAERAGTFSTGVTTAFFFCSEEVE